MSLVLASACVWRVWGVLSRNENTQKLIARGPSSVRAMTHTRVAAAGRSRPASVKTRMTTGEKNPLVGGSRPGTPRHAPGQQPRYSPRNNLRGSSRSLPLGVPRVAAVCKPRTRHAFTRILGSPMHNRSNRVRRCVRAVEQAQGRRKRSVAERSLRHPLARQGAPPHASVAKPELYA